MLKNIELSREVAKAEYKRLKGDADLKLAAPAAAKCSTKEWIRMPNSRFPVPVAFQKRFTDECIRYYLSSEREFTALIQRNF
jgi:hypothetical protein